MKNIKKIANKYILEVVKSGISVNAAYLFGSYAKGNSNKDSDIDICIVSSKFGKDYFQELLERVRSIRTSERRIYLQITDIFAECSVDYDKNSEIAKDFFATVQNKFHFPITGNTAAEIIYEKADAKKEKMGLLSWKKRLTIKKEEVTKVDTVLFPAAPSLSAITFKQ